MAAFFYGILGGVVAWLATTFLAQPLSRFLSLRSETARLLSLYEDHYDVTDPDKEPPSANWIAERKHAYELNAADLRAFATAHVIFARFLQSPLLGRFRVYPKSAADYVRLLGQTRPGTQPEAECRERIRSGLKLKWPA